MTMNETYIDPYLVVGAIVSTIPCVVVTVAKWLEWRRDR